MEITDGGGGALGGTASSMCAISPSDLVGTIGNLISRIENLELALSQVLGANLHANTLGDISSQVGWVYGVEYMGIPGWIQTEYGTLIPPPGFTLLGSGIKLSDGNTYSAVSYDSNGVLQFGFSSDGMPAGDRVDAWNNAAAGEVTMDYARLEYNRTNGNITATRGSSISLGSINTSPNVIVTANINTAGFYLASVQGSIEKVGETSSTCRVDLTASTDNYPSNPVAEAYSVTNQVDGGAAWSFLSRTVYFSAAGTITAQTIKPAGYDVNTCKLNIARLSN